MAADRKVLIASAEGVGCGGLSAFSTQSAGDMQRHQPPSSFTANGSQVRLQRIA